VLSGTPLPRFVSISGTGETLSRSSPACRGLRRPWHPSGRAS